MASEALNKFTELFNTKFNSEIASTRQIISELENKVEARKELHRKVLDQLRANPNARVKPEEFLKIFPEEGGENIIIDAFENRFDPKYVALLNVLPNEAKMLVELASSDYSLGKNQKKLKILEEFRTKGPDQLMKDVGVFIKKYFYADKVGFFGTREKPKEYDAKSWEQTIYVSTDGTILDFVPKDLISDISAFTILQEKFYNNELANPDEGVDFSPINVVPVSTEKGVTESPINLPIAGKTQIKPIEGASPAITSTLTLAAAIEPESRVVAVPETINIPVESIPEEIIKVGEKEVGDIFARKEQVLKTQEVINQTISSLNISEEKKSGITNILNQFSQTLGSAPRGEFAGINERFQSEFRSLEKSKETLLKALGAKTQPVVQTPAINIPVAATSEFTNIAAGTTENVSNVASTINTANQNQASTVFNTQQQDILNQFKKSIQMLSPQEKAQTEAKRVGVSEAIKVIENKMMMPQGSPISAAEPVIERSTVQLNERVQPFAQTAVASTTQNFQNVGSPVQTTELNQSTTTSAIAPVSETIASSQMQPLPETNINFNTSIMEKRLRRIEELLSSPLTVKLS